MAGDPPPEQAVDQSLWIELAIMRAHSPRCLREQAVQNETSDACPRKIESLNSPGGIVSEQRNIVSLPQQFAREVECVEAAVDGDCDLHIREVRVFEHPDDSVSPNIAVSLSPYVW